MTYQMDQETWTTSGTTSLDLIHPYGKPSFVWPELDIDTFALCDDCNATDNNCVEHDVYEQTWREELMRARVAARMEAERLRRQAIKKLNPVVFEKLQQEPSDDEPNWVQRQRAMILYRIACLN